MGFSYTKNSSQVKYKPVGYVQVPIFVVFQVLMTHSAAKDAQREAKNALQLISKLLARNENLRSVYGIFTVSHKYHI